LACLSVLTVLLAALLAASPASADTRIGPIADTGGIAVNEAENGDLYVLSRSGQRVEVFHSNGAFARSFGWGVLNGAAELQICTAQPCHNGIEGSGPGQFRWEDEIAVDNAYEGGANPSYGDVYVVDQRNFRVEKFDPEGHFLLMFGGEVNKTAVAESRPVAEQNLCPAPGHPSDTCGAGLPGTGPAHFYQEGLSTTWNNNVPSWGTEGSNSIALGPAGTVYVGDFGRVQEFKPSGEFKGEFELPDAEKRFVTALAVNSSSDIFERSSTHAGSQVPGVREWNAESPRALLHTLDATGEPTYIALNATGDLFVSDLNGSAANPPTGEFQFRAYLPDGTLYAEFGSDQIKSFGPIIGGIAIGDAASKLYATSFEESGQVPNTHFESYVAVIPLPEFGPPLVAPGSEHATDVEAGTASLHATVNAHGHDTHYRFEYVDQHDFEAHAFTECEGPANPNCHKTTLTDIGLLIKNQPVVAAVSGLAHDTTYHFRVVAESECHGPSPEPKCVAEGEDATLTTLPPVSVRDFTTQTVGPELVTLKAELDPNNSLTKTRWEICIGEDTNYTTGCDEGELPAGSSQFEEITATFEHLQPNTPYHYQLTVENENITPGQPVKSSDQNFTTELSTAEERAAEDCPENGTVHGEAHSTLREQNESLALPDCRAYEMVSPPNKANNSVDGLKFRLAPSGERVLFSSQGAFAGTVKKRSGVQYVSHRTPAGWVTESTYAHLPPESDQQLGDPLDFSANLDAWAGHLAAGLTWQDGERPTSESIYLGTSSGFFQQVSPTYQRAGGGIMSSGSPFLAQSADLSHIVIGTPYRLLPAEDPLPEISGTPGNLRLYEISGAGGPEPKMKLAVEIPAGLNGAAGCEIDPGFGGVMAQNLNNLSADGSTLFYASPLELAPGEHCEASLAGPNKYALFARTGEAPPIQISSPPLSQCEPSSPCHSAAPQNVHFYGASADATRAWFTTTQPLVDSDADQTESPKSNDLYLARLQGGQLTELVQVSRGEATDPHRGEGAGLQGVLRLSQDASHAFFVATGVLTTQPNSNGASQGEAATEGADNLYAYDSESGETKFVARLCSGPGESGSTFDNACGSNLESVGQALNDTKLWNGTAVDSDATLDGHYLLFRSFARLTADDTDNAADLYRYDVSTGQLTRVSIGRRGNDGGGNDDAFNAAFAHHAFTSILPFAESGAGDESRAISADGSTAIFTTEAPLVFQDTNEAADVYQWEEQGHDTCAETGGCVSLVSPGSDPHGSAEGLIGSSGKDVIFTTAHSIVRPDIDGLRDVYDAHVEGGFHAPSIPEVCRSAETCHGPVPPELPPPSISTPNFVGPGNEPEKLHCGKGRHRVRRHGEFRCVPNKTHKHKTHHKRANTNRRAGK
jgi:hypothetical protein